MSVLPYQHIKALCLNLLPGGIDKPLVEPFAERTVFHGLSYGCGVAGYDFRVKFTEGQMTYLETVSDCIIMRPGQFLLATTVERFAFPTNILGYVKDKSTWARQGLALQNTVLEPGWEGFITLELSNHSGVEIYIRNKMPIGQVVFHTLTESTEMPYTGKYQNQIQMPIPSLKEIGA